MVATCVDLVYDEETAYDDFTEKEMIKFLEQFNSSQFRRIESFFDTMPKLSHTITVTNPNTGVENEVVLEGCQVFSHKYNYTALSHTTNLTFLSSSIINTH